MDRKPSKQDQPHASPPEGPEGGNSLDDASKEAVREIEKRRDGSGGYSGAGDIG